MEKRRTWVLFGLGTGAGVLLSVACWWGGENTLRIAGQDESLPLIVHYLVISLNGLLAGLMLGKLVPYFPSWEGFLSSLSIIGCLAVRDLSMLGTENISIQQLLSVLFQPGLDNFVERLLTFESHFAMVCFGAFIPFLARGGGLYQPIFVGLRYLRFKMITGIAVFGVFLGVAAMIVVLSVMSGFENDLKSKVVGTNAHAILQKRGTDFTEYDTVIEKIQRVRGVAAVSPFVYNEVMVSSEYNISGVFIKGIEPKTAGAVTDLDRSVSEGNLDLLEHPEKIDAYLEERIRKSLPPGDNEDEPASDGLPRNGVGSSGGHSQTPPVQPPKPTDPVAAKSDPTKAQPSGVRFSEDQIIGSAQAAAKKNSAIPVPEPLHLEGSASGTSGIFIGKELKKILKVRLGDRVNMVSPLSEELGPSGPVPKARAFRVAGIFYTGMYEYDAKSVYVTKDSAQKFFGMGDAVTGIALKFKDIDRAGPICEEILSVLDGYPYFTRTWYEMNKNLFSALKMEKVAMFILVIIVTLVAAFGIICTLIMLVWEKIKEIAILKSMGSTGDGVMKIFMVQGILIGLVGTLLGLLGGWVTCLLLQKYGIQLNPEVYYIEKLPVNMDVVEFVLIAGIALHISFIATIYPAGRASRLRPVDGLRYE